jgi:hypothetical protein
MAFSSFKFLSENKDAAKAAGKVGAKVFPPNSYVRTSL